MQILLLIHSSIVLLQSINPPQTHQFPQKKKFMPHHRSFEERTRENILHSMAPPLPAAAAAAGSSAAALAELHHAVLLAPAGRHPLVVHHLLYQRGNRRLHVVPCPKIEMVQGLQARKSMPSNLRVEGAPVLAEVSNHRKKPLSAATLSSATPACFWPTPPPPPPAWGEGPQRGGRCTGARQSPRPVTEACDRVNNILWSEYG